MRNYIIIGGSSGIGQQLVRLLEKQGANVIATYNNNLIEEYDKELEEIEKELAEEQYISD